MGTRFLRPNQIRDSLEEKTTLEAQLAQSTPDGTLSRSEIGAQLQRVNKFLDEGTPPPTTPERRDELRKSIARLGKEISENMPTREDMVRKLPGAGDHSTKWEKANKKKIFQWKDDRRELDPTNEDVDYTNIEILRRENDLGKIVPFRQYPGVDMRDGEIVPGGIPDAEKIEARIAQPVATVIASSDAVAVLEQEEPDKPVMFTAECGDCGKEFIKDSKKKADSAVRLHRITKHK